MGSARHLRRTSHESTDREPFARAVDGLLALDREEDGGRTAVFSDGRLRLVATEGLWPGAGGRAKNPYLVEALLA